MLTSGFLKAAGWVCTGTGVLASVLSGVIDKKQQDAKITEEVEKAVSKAIDKLNK